MMRRTKNPFSCYAFLVLFFSCHPNSSGFAFCPVHTNTRATSHLLVTTADDDSHDFINNPKSSRRNFLNTAVVTTTASLSPLLFIEPKIANADPSLMSSLQGPIQDVIAPGHWIGQFLGFNARTVLWKFDTAAVNADRVCQALVEVLNDLSSKERAALRIPEFTFSQDKNSHRVHVLTWTKNEWLDSLDMSFLPSSTSTTTTTNGCTAKVSFYATGVLPTSIPGAPIVNTVLAWFPFVSPGPRGQMLQDYRLQSLEQLVRNKLKEQRVAEAN